MFSLIATAFAAPAVAPMTEIAVYDRLEESDLTLVDVPEALEHEHLIRTLDEAVGRIALEPLLPGEPLRAERLGTDARTTLLGPGQSLVMVRFGMPQVWPPGRVDLVAMAEGGPCLLAEDVRSHGSPEPGVLSVAMSALDAFQAQWAMSQLIVLPLSRNPIDRDRRPDLACGGGLPVNAIRVAAGGGVLLRLGEPVAEMQVASIDHLLVDQPTHQDLWFHGGRPGRTAALVHLTTGAPVLLDVEVVDEPIRGRAEPVGGLVVLDAQDVIDAQLSASNVGTVELARGRAIVRVAMEVPFQVFTRTKDGELDLHDIVGVSSWPAPSRGEVVLPLKPGRRRKVAMPAAVVAAWSGDDDVASVEVKGRKARVIGTGKGTTRVVLMDESGETSSLRVVLP